MQAPGDEVQILASTFGGSGRSVRLPRRDSVGPSAKSTPVAPRATTRRRTEASDAVETSSTKSGTPTTPMRLVVAVIAGKNRSRSVTASIAAIPRPM